MRHRPKNLINAKHKELYRSIKSVLSNDRIDQFNPEIIERLFQHGTKCVNLPFRYNTLNIVIILSGKYVNSFEDAKTKLIAEQNAIKVIDIVIKHGARGIDNIQEANTLSIAMNCANINILKFLINVNLDMDLSLKPYNHAEYSINYPSNCQTLECALSASHKTGNPEFFRIALDNGARLYNYHHDLAQNIFVSKIVSIADCIVFGSKELINTLARHFVTISRNYVKSDFTTEQKIEIMEMIICTIGYNFFYKYNFYSKQIEDFINVCHDLFNNKYFRYNKNSVRYKNIIEIRNRLESRIRWLTNFAMVHNKNNNRKTIIENELIVLPVALIDIISEYEYTRKFEVIDLSKY